MEGIDILLLQIFLILDNKKMYNVRILLQSINRIRQINLSIRYLISLPVKILQFHNYKNV